MSSAVAGLTSHSQKPGSPALARTSASKPVTSTTSTSSRNLMFLTMSFSLTCASSRKNITRPSSASMPPAATCCAGRATAHSRGSAEPVAAPAAPDVSGALALPHQYNRLGLY